MIRTESGAACSAKAIGEIKGLDCLCCRCSEVFTPSMERDCFLVEDEGGAEGEKALICERCFDEELISQGKRIVDLAQPFLGLSIWTWLRLVVVAVVGVVIYATC